MQLALAEARRALGTTWPNPAVGCVIAAEGRILAAARTAPGGRPHAETQALAEAGAAAAGATAYVTLEPCAHHGQTPPCAEALIAARIGRAVVAVTDPDPRTDGAGLAKLRAAGIAVELGEGQAEAEEILGGFFTRLRLGRPRVTLKLAATLDGRIATHAGEARWITGGLARRHGHALRAVHDAVMVGVGTVLADDPELTCRLPGAAPRPAVRVVADSHLRTPLVSRLAATAAVAPVWLLHRDGADPARLAALAGAGLRPIACAAGGVGVDPAAALAALGAAGLTSVLVEGGAQLAASLLRAGLVDRIAWYGAPAVMGGDGWPAVQPIGTAALAELRRFRPLANRALGPDMLTILTPA